MRRDIIDMLVAQRRKSYLNLLSYLNSLHLVLLPVMNNFSFSCFRFRFFQRKIQFFSIYVVVNK
jgi:hypothetical protein